MGDRISCSIWGLTLVTMLEIILLAHVPAIVQADDSAYYGDGYNVYPIENSDVQLVAETIVITDNFAFGRTPPVGKGRFTINVDMTFKNHETDTTLQMGFPVMIKDRGGELVEIDTHFRTRVNGRELGDVVENLHFSGNDGN
jgi:hypothetical protein